MVKKKFRGFLSPAQLLIKAGEKLFPQAFAFFEPFLRRKPRERKAFSPGFCGAKGWLSGAAGI